MSFRPRQACIKHCQLSTQGGTGLLRCTTGLGKAFSGPQKWSWSSPFWETRSLLGMSFSTGNGRIQQGCFWPCCQKEGALGHMLFNRRLRGLIRQSGTCLLHAFLHLAVLPVTKLRFPPPQCITVALGKFFLPPLLIKTF